MLRCSGISANVYLTFACHNNLPFILNLSPIMVIRPLIQNQFPRMWPNLAVSDDLDVFDYYFFTRWKRILD